jgi:CheY-like chemotaxis protein
MSIEETGTICWNCDETVGKIVRVFLQASRAEPVALSLCERCYETFYLPLAETMAHANRESDPDQTILIVDDDPHLRTFVSLALEGEGFRVDLAANGEEALKKVQSAPPSAIVLDLWMPVMDGPSFLAELRRTVPTPAIPVLVISAYERTLTAGGLGVEAFLSKPFKLDTLLSTVHHLVRSKA